MPAMTHAENDIGRAFGILFRKSVDHLDCMFLRRILRERISPPQGELN
jgi:hypothetical protein